jgi:hypothetical protein
MLRSLRARLSSHDQAIYREDVCLSNSDYEAASSKAARSHRSTSKAAPPAGRGSCSRSTAPRAPWRSCRPTLVRRLTYRSQSSLCAVRRRANRWRISRYRSGIAGSHPRSRRGFLSMLRSCTSGWLKAFAKESPSAQTSMWPSNATSCLTRFRRRRTPGAARFFSVSRQIALSQKNTCEIRTWPYGRLYVQVDTCRFAHHPARTGPAAQFSSSPSSAVVRGIACASSPRL